uniref:Uncharacterized protein n=1 Tax=Candidatus Kentrum sp. MB TaxID=2138164 RepID=A0A450X9L6_9GAMM|nr:MAG: hypothetical protein BECKMB1821G_GA0114241_101722 [Candidatus Kentron sp. MB]
MASLSVEYIPDIFTPAIRRVLVHTGSQCLDDECTDAGMVFVVGHHTTFLVIAEIVRVYRKVYLFYQQIEQI